MAEELSSEETSGAGAARAYFLPRHRVGWVALVLLLATALYPVYWGGIETQVRDAAALVALAVVVVVAAVGLGSVALFWTRDQSVLLSMVYAMAVFLVLLGLMFVLLLTFSGL